MSTLEWPTIALDETVSLSTPLLFAVFNALMTETVPEEHLRAALSDAMSGVRLPSTRRVLTLDDRHEIELAIFRRLKLNEWSVVREPLKGFSGLWQGPGEQ
jgi:hypothetical protein